jgi:hypothetical protein
VAVKAGVVLPAEDARRERRRSRRPEDQGHVHHRRGIGKDGKDGQADQPVKRRQDAEDEPPHPAVAEGAHQPVDLRRTSLRQRGEYHQKQERDLLDQQAGGHGHTKPIMDHEQIGRTLPAGQPGRDKPGQQAGWRDQEGKPERRRRMRNAEQRRDEPLHDLEHPCAPPAGDERQHCDDGKRRRAKPGIARRSRKGSSETAVPPSAGR